MAVLTSLAALALLFGAILGMIELGRQFGLRRRRLAGPLVGISAMEGAAFALLGLLVAFTFNGAANRFDVRRQQIVDETNALGTAWLRVDLLPAADQPEVRRLFRSYVDERIAFYNGAFSREAVVRHQESLAVRQAALWSAAVTALRPITNPAIPTLVLTPLNESFDLAGTRLAMTEIHPPPLIWVLLAILTSICCLLAGFDLSVGRRSWLHILTLAVLLTATIYVIADFEYPRVGLIRLHALDHLLVDLRAGMR